MDLEASLWRAATRADDLPEFLSRLSTLLSPQVAMSGLSAWILNPEEGLVPLASHPVASLHTKRLTDPERRRFLAWHRRGTPLLWKRGDRDEGPSAFFRQVGDQEDGVVVVPVSLDDGAAAALVVALGGAPSRDTLRRASKGRISAEARQAMSRLAEPVGAALDHARRVAELGALRRAAEADRETLLRRLGRERLADEIVGADGGLKTVLERVSLVARSDLPVLIFGETGAGKEVIARAVHDRSPRRDRPFIRVNCGAIPPDLIDSELFGHERGSFTGATAQRRGWFEQADTGTLFLDEVGDLPLPAQVRLLRVLQDGTMQRVGGQQAIHVDVRIVAATHRDLPALVERKEFREDLWYRLASFPVYLPPLRERPGDIAPLAEHFVRKAARRFGVPTPSLSAGDLARLSAYPWPGNVRELASVIDRAVIVGEGRSLALDIALGSPVPARPTADAQARRTMSSDDSPGDALDDVVKRHIESVLERTRGVIEGHNGAAAILRINPHTLRARMRKLHIRWDQFRGIRLNPGST